MKKLIIVFIASLLVVGVANACPKGTSPHGGTGSHHKGGYCA